MGFKVKWRTIKNEILFWCWRNRCWKENQAKGMLEVKRLAVEFNSWFASSRSTFHFITFSCSTSKLPVEHFLNLKNIKMMNQISTVPDRASLRYRNWFSVSSCDSWRLLSLHALHLFQLFYLLPRTEILWFAN